MSAGSSEADAPRHVLKVVVAKLEGDHAEALLVLAHFRGEAIRNSAEMREDEGVVGHVLEEGLLLAVALRLRGFAHDLAIVDAASVGP